MLSTLAAALERKHVLRSCLLPVIIILYYLLLLPGIIIILYHLLSQIQRRTQVSGESYYLIIFLISAHLCSSLNLLLLPLGMHYLIYY